MNDETNLPDGLQTAVEVLAYYTEGLGDEAEAEYAVSVNAIRAEHAKHADLQHAYHRQRDAAQARVDAAVVRALAAEKERDELRARLAGIEAQEPVALLAPAEVSDDWPWPHIFCAADAHPHIQELMDAFPLYARPVPAIPADPGMITVSMAPSSAYAMGWNDCRAKMITASIAEARREGAEAMREAAATQCETKAQIRALPLPTWKRQAVRLTDEDVKQIGNAALHAAHADDTRHIDAQAAEIERLQDLLETAVRQNNAGKLMTQSHIADCCSILKGTK